MSPCRQEMIDVEAKDGVSSKITVFTEDPAQTSPVLVCMPAMGISAKFYEPLAAPLLRQGFRFVTADLRGVGTSSLRVSKGVSFGYRVMVDFDWPAVMGKVKALFPGAPLYLLGHSLGGQLSALYLAADPDGASGLILVAAPSVHYGGWGFPLNLGHPVWVRNPEPVIGRIGAWLSEIG